jgi:hypothetical protein
MNAFVLTMIIIVYGGNGFPVTTATVSHDFNSKEACEAALTQISTNIRDGAPTHASCTSKG